MKDLNEQEIGAYVYGAFLHDNKSNLTLVADRFPFLYDGVLGLTSQFLQGKGLKCKLFKPELRLVCTNGRREIGINFVKTDNCQGFDNCIHVSESRPLNLK